MTGWWCEHALLPNGLASGVSIEVIDGRFRAITADTTASPGSTRLPGLTLPGFANSHSHAFHRALRSRVQADRGSFWTWREMMYKAAERLDPENYFRLARAVFAEMAGTGMTTVGEFHYVHHGPDGVPYDNPNAMGEALISAAGEVGVRITLLDTLYLHSGFHSGFHSGLHSGSPPAVGGGGLPPQGVQRRFSDETAHRWVERISGRTETDHARIGAAIHSVRAVDPEAMSVAAEWARDHDAPLHAHVSEQRAENDQCLQRWGRTPTALLAEAGALEAHFTAVHATHLTDDDISLLGDSGASVCFCPTTESDLGDGIGPSSELVSAGAVLCLGSDSHAVIDQMADARAVEWHERLRSERRGLHSAAELLEAATVAGHRSLGWLDVGALSQGQRADLVTLSLESPRLAGAPADLLVEAAVFASSASDITSVVVDGVPIVSDGVHKSIDPSAELASAIEELLV